MTLIGGAYRWIASTFSSRPTNFSWVIKNQVAGSGLPITLNQFKWLIDHRIRTIVTVREVPLPLGWIKLINQDKGPKDSSNISTISYLHVPVEDYNSPTNDQNKNNLSYNYQKVVSN
jgi:hypothetical protein